MPLVKSDGDVTVNKIFANFFFTNFFLTNFFLTNFFFANSGCGDSWELTFLWKVRESGPTGTQIGPDKQTVAAWYTPGNGIGGVSYGPDEVPLIPGQTYFIEFNYVTGPGCGGAG